MKSRAVRRFKGLVVFVISLTIGATIALAQEPTPKGYMGIWVQPFANSQFYEGFREAMQTYGGSDGYSEFELYYDCHHDIPDPSDCVYGSSQYNPPHLGLLLEAYRYWDTCNPPAPPQNGGLNRNDEGATILVVNSHGDVIYNPTYNIYTYCFSNEGLYHDNARSVDRAPCGIGCTLDTCLRNMSNSNCYDANALIRFGASTAMSVGDGTTRYVLLNTCHGLDLQYDRDSDGNIEPADGDVGYPCLLLRIWNYNDLNGGYRIVAGVSGRFSVGGHWEDGYDFVRQQLKEDNLPFRYAWFMV